MQDTQPRPCGCSLSRSIAMALGLGGAAASWAQTAGTTPGNELEEVVVTATRRSENLQNVPIAITALTGTVLSELNVQTLEDYVKYLPNVSTAGVAPGQDEVYMRGLATTHQGSQVVGEPAHSPMSRFISTTNPCSFRGAISTSTRWTWRESRCWKVRRAPCTARARKPGRYATSPINQSR